MRFGKGIVEKESVKKSGKRRQHLIGNNNCTLDLFNILIAYLGQLQYEMKSRANEKFCLNLILRFFFLRNRLHISLLSPQCFLLDLTEKIS